MDIEITSGACGGITKRGNPLIPRLLSAAVIKARIRALEKQAAKLGRKDSKGLRAVAAYIDKHGLLVDDVKAAFGMSRGRVKRGPLAGTKAPVKYRDDSGSQWSGRGRPPLWLVEAERAGRNRESYLIDKPAKPTPKPEPKAKSAKPPKPPKKIG